jgi:hypothetical protein
MPPIVAPTGRAVVAAAVTLSDEATVRLPSRARVRTAMLLESCPLLPAVVRRTRILDHSPAAVEGAYRAVQDVTEGGYVEPSEM